MNNLNGLTVGTVTTGGYVPQTNTVDWTGIYGGYYQYPQYVTVPQTICAGDIHVFPCPHCDKCKCGRALKVKQG